MVLRRSLVLYRLLVICLTLFCLPVIPAHSAPEAARVTRIPGFNGTLPSRHYAGYVNIDEARGKYLYYYFVESERNSSADPVVLWLNGGPGCSSFDGFVYEHGPFNFEEAKTGLLRLRLNPYSWSKVSNIIYLDSPVGVGFSYSKNNSDYDTGDLQTASDTHIFLLKWFQLYPEFVSNPFYIAGESYAGVYVPTLAAEIVRGLDAGTRPVLNFKGYLVGNGVADPTFDGDSALVKFTHGMGLISDQQYEEIMTECENIFDAASKLSDASCASKIEKVSEAVAELNMYDILEPCYHGRESIDNAINTKIPSSFRELGETERPLAVRKRIYGRAWPLRAPVHDGPVPTWPQLLGKMNSLTVPCTDDTVATAWLNDASIRKALHAEEESLVGRWQLCTDKISHNHDAGSMLSYHKNLTSRGFRALIYSGDHDMCVPFTGTEAWTRSLGYDIIDEWRPWMSNDQVAGYLQGYGNNLTFLTIKGAGHTVPEYKPRESLDFFSRFLAGKPI